jgi:hypothetical protein
MRCFSDPQPASETGNSWMKVTGGTTMAQTPSEAGCRSHRR